MSKRLTVQLVQARLMEEESVKAAKAQKQKLSTVKAGERKAGKDPALSQTKIKQIEVPKDKMPAEQKGSGQAIPTADFADTYTKKMPHGNKTLNAGATENQKSPKMPKSKSDKPNQETKLSLVKNPIKNTEDDGDQKADFIPTADFASSYTKKMPHGAKNLKAGNEEGGEGVKKPKVASLTQSKGAKSASTTRPTANQRKAKGLGDDRATKKVTQIAGPKGFSKDPSDAMNRKVKVQKQTGGAHNVVESGIAVYLKGKRKATFEVVSRDLLKKMVESYENVGYKVQLRKYQPEWKSNKPLIDALRESVHAKMNFAPKVAKEYRKIALMRFRNLVQGSYSRMYESRDDFNKVVWKAFKKIEAVAKQRYVEGLEPFEVIARMIHDDVEVDVEIMTEATDHQMACRQTIHKLAEEYGLDVSIRHIMVDGRKHVPAKVKPYTPRKV